MKWWRLCFDEAQTVETARMVSEMAQKLVAVHRWAVTGTPISKDITGNNNASLPDDIMFLLGTYKT